MSLTFDSIRNILGYSTSDCTSSAVISHMVAAPVIEQRQATHGSSGYPTTSVKLVPRKGVTESWTDELADLLSARRLTGVSREQAAPTLGETASRLPGVAAHLVEAVHQALLSEWWTEATQMYQLAHCTRFT